MAYELTEAQWQEHQRQFHTWLLQNVGLTADMLKTLEEKDDDWTFIIKIHAILEVALNHMVSGLLNRPELADIIPRMNVHGNTGKIAVAQSFNALSDAHVKFIKLMSEMRKHMVHDIKNFDFDLMAYLGTLDKPQLEHWKCV